MISVRQKAAKLLIVVIGFGQHAGTSWQLRLGQPHSKPLSPPSKDNTMDRHAACRTRHGRSGELRRTWGPQAPPCCQLEV
jgi:hypothetical protein